MTARRGWSATVALACLVVLAGCGVSPEDESRPIDPPRRPSAAGSVPTHAEPTGVVPERLFLVRDDALVPVTRHVQRQPSISVLVADLLAGPTAAEQRAGLSTALVGASVITSVTVTGGMAAVELAPPAEGTARNDDRLAYGQIVCTLTARQEISGVVFTRDHQPIGVPRDDGSRSTGPLTALDYADLVAEN